MEDGMDNGTDKPLSHRSRRGTETRQRGRLLGIRLTAEEYAPLEQGAANAGLKLASHARELLVNAPKTRSRRRPLADVAAISALYAQLAKSGSNLNQIAKQLNSGERVLADRIEETLAAHWEIICALRNALGVSE
jgi:hypothetical protein